MGIAVEFLVGQARITAYQHSDFIFKVEVEDVNQENTLTPAEDFTDAEYIIADDKGRVLIRKTLGDGISISGELFKVHVDDAEMTFLGPCKHQFVVYATNGDKLPPIFHESLKIVPSFI